MTTGRLNKIFRAKAYWITAANGMDHEDIITSLREIETRFKMDGGEAFFVLGLLNRLPPTASPESISGWASLIDACNAAIQSAYPSPVRSLNLQDWFTASGMYSESGYSTLAWFPGATPEQVAADRADQLAGLVPRSVRPSEDDTHLNSTGYTAIGHLVCEALRS